jgi:hypothetical protein
MWKRKPTEVKKGKKLLGIADNFNTYPKKNNNYSKENKGFRK